MPTTSGLRALLAPTSLLLPGAAVFAADIDRLLRAGKLQYQLNIDVVSYSKTGTRQNFNYNGSEEPAGGEAGTGRRTEQGSLGGRVERGEGNLRIAPLIPRVPWGSQRPALLK